MKEYLNVETKEIQTFDFLDGTISIFSAKKENGEINQDSSAIIQINNDYGILIVADGIGGHNNGALASKTAIKLAQKICSNAKNPNKAQECRNFLNNIYKETTKDMNVEEQNEFAFDVFYDLVNTSWTYCTLHNEFQKEPFDCLLAGTQNRQLTGTSKLAIF